MRTAIQILCQFCPILLSFQAPPVNTKQYRHPVRLTQPTHPSSSEPDWRSGKKGERI